MSTIGYWGSIIGLLFPWIFAAIQLGITEEGNMNAFPGYWDVFELTVNLAMWLGISLIHIFFVPPFLAHVAATYRAQCRCDLPKVQALGENASADQIGAFDKATAERAYLCGLQCPDGEVD
jgi:hypothetical protein